MRKRDPEGKKRMIVESAIKAFLQKGYAKTTMDDIVALSGVSKGGVYWHFKGKEEICLYLLKTWVDETYAYYQEIRENDETTEQKLRMLVKHAFYNPDKPIIGLGQQFWLHNLANPTVIAAIQEIYGRYQEMFRWLLFDGMVKGEFETYDIEDVTLSFMGLLDGITNYQMLMDTEENRYSNKPLVTALEVFLRGIRKA